MAGGSAGCESASDLRYARLARSNETLERTPSLYANANVVEREDVGVPILGRTAELIAAGKSA